ncbi:MAG: PilZ domain-containing protein [Pseudolabrys sp.]
MRSTGNSTMDCRVRDFSATGARVQLTNTAIVPDQFDLTIARKERSFRASMVWRSVNEAGVAFLGEYNNENGRAAGVGQAPATKRS